MAKNGRVKGCRGEREVAAMLAEWWGAYDPGCKFVRTPSSGGWSAAKVRSEFRASGDIMTTSQLFPFVVEVKRREAFAWATFAAGRACPVWAWWEQTERAAAEQVGGVPMLWLRHNGEPWRVVVRAELADRLVASRLVARRWLVMRGVVSPVSGMGVTMMAAAVVLQTAPSDVLRVCAEGYRGEN